MAAESGCSRTAPAVDVGRARLAAGWLSQNSTRLDSGVGGSDGGFPSLIMLHGWCGDCPPSSDAGDVAPEGMTDRRCSSGDGRTMRDFTNGDGADLRLASPAPAPAPAPPPAPRKDGEHLRKNMLMHLDGSSGTDSHESNHATELTPWADRRERRCRGDCELDSISSSTMRFSGASNTSSVADTRVRDDGVGTDAGGLRPPCDDSGRTTEPHGDGAYAV